LVELSGDLELQLSDAKAAVELASQNADAQLRVMSGRVAELQARLARMETIARNLAGTQPDMAVAVDFSSPVALGGPGLADDVVMTDVVNQLSLLEARLTDRERQLGVLENLLIGDDVAARLSPKGRPIVEGWLSSPFGKRTDPFTGKAAWHNGIDFAGAEGGDIISVADGIVTYAGRRHGYGLMVEVTHADGYATRYAHNRENLVAVGAQVVAGEVIARMGMTGRSTGPHVHFELLKNGKKVNPWKVVASRRQ
jgi:murein DD-endopeptidase MepM/ murein hydrolase activator NlpD